MGLMSICRKIANSKVARGTLAGIIGFGIATPVVLAQDSIVHEQQIEVNETNQKNNSNDVFVDVKYKTKYVGADGVTFIDNPVVQASVGVDTGKFSVDVWTNYDTETGEVTELDPELNVPFETDRINGNFYAGHFTFPNSDINEASQIDVTLSPKNLPLDVSLYSAQIFGEDSEHGQLFRGSVGKTFGLGENANASLEGNLSYNNGYFSKEKGFSHATGTASINYDLTDKLSVSSSVSYQEPIGDFKDSLENELYGSVGVNVKF